jgi:hypothetical protein
MHAFGRDFEDEDDMYDYIDYLIEEGILEEDGFDEDGDIVYICNYKMMKEKNFELYELMMSDTNQALLSLYKEGLISVEYDENLEAHFYPTEKGKENFKNNKGDI